MAAGRIVFASPKPPFEWPPAEPSPWQGIQATWEGWDGSRWDLADAGAGIFLQREGVEGLHMPPHTAWTTSSPATHGQTYRGHRIGPRPVFWLIHIFSDSSSEEWVERDRAFWRTLQPGRIGTWTVKHPGQAGPGRTLRLRLDDSQSGHSFDTDPVEDGYAIYEVPLIADDPFWHDGETVERVWDQEAGDDFFNGEDKAPEFNIIADKNISSASIPNPGDVEAWPIWEAHGPINSFTFTVAGRQVAGAINVPTGQVLKIDTNPRVQTAWLGSTDVTNQLTKDDFAPVPAGAEIPLGIVIDGTGTVSASIRPRYYRAW